jgi:hypothetical protein
MIANFYLDIVASEVEILLPKNRTMGVGDWGMGIGDWEEFVLILERSLPNSIEQAKIWSRDLNLTNNRGNM